MRKFSLTRRILSWRLKNITGKQFVTILSIVVGIASGLGAVVIKNLVHFISESVEHIAYEGNSKYLIIVVPPIGILLAVLFIKYVIRRPVRHGVPNVLYAISKNNGIINRHNMFSSIVASALTVGMGGSVGLEGPTVSTGAAIGSNIGRAFRLNYKQITLLLGCAASAAMSAIFKAPIAAVVFAIEVIMLDLTVASILPLLLASASALLTSYYFMGQNVLYPFDVTHLFKLAELPYYILLGVFTGLVSAYFIKTYVYIEGKFSKITNIYNKLLVGGISLGILLAFFPTLYGEGYKDINACLSGSTSYLFKNPMFLFLQDNIYGIAILLFVVILLKVIAASVTFGAGGVGGIFAPTLFMGVNAGMLFSKVINHLGLQKLPVNNFALIGMAGMIAGVLHAPLTGIFLIAELSGGYELFVPLMITATFSFLVTKLLTTHSVYTIQLARRKELITHNKDQAILTLMNVQSLIETNFSTVNADDTLGDFVKIVSTSKRNVFPVIDDENNMLGIIFITEIRDIIFKRELYDSTFMTDLMFMPQSIVDPDESMEEVAKKFSNSPQYNLPVLKEGKYLGFVSRANVFSAYREKLREFSEY
ncbi:MAG: chloride channel protein [Salinivirgaceae bacterium]|jgi:CIC family chloride channel protein|nr:chloride channel protein [Salinivirgaceae bacterium]